MNGAAAILLDLDDTLIDTAGLLLGPARLEAGAAMVAAGLPGTAEEAAAALARITREHPGENPFDLLAEERGADPFRAGMAGWSTFFKRPVPASMPLLPGVREALERWGRRGVLRLLVTFGDPPTQHAKIVACALPDLVDAIEYEPLAPRADKGRAFRALIEARGLNPQRCIVIGDRPDAEIRAGNALGMRTIRIKRGEHEANEGTSTEDRATVTVRDFESAARAADALLEVGHG